MIIKKYTWHSFVVGQDFPRASIPCLYTVNKVYIIYSVDAHYKATKQVHIYNLYWSLEYSGIECASGKKLYYDLAIFCCALQKWEFCKIKRNSL